MKQIESGLIKQSQLDAVMAALKKGSYDPSYISSLSGTGPVQEFEDAFAFASGGKYALALSSCTAAIHTALMAFRIGPGDEVIVTPYTWGQSVAPVLFVGATAVFADIDPKTLTIDPKSVENRISKKTKAIIPVHIFGNPSDMDSLSSLAEKYKIAIISDAAQAFGALSKGRKIGSLGDAACFSLGRGKAVSGGEGGVLVTNNERLYERSVAITQHPLRAFREITSEPGLPFQDELGWNYRIHPLAAVLALVDLEVASERVACRKQIANKIQQELEPVQCLEPIQCYPGDSSAAYGIPLTFKYQENIGQSRELLAESLQSKGINIQPGPIGVPIHLRPTFQKNNSGLYGIVPHPTHRKGSCPVVEFRCKYQELQLFNASDLDKVLLKQSQVSGKHGLFSWNTD